MAFSNLSGLSWKLTFIFTDSLFSLTMLALVRLANELCQAQRYWLPCSQELESGLCFELLRSALQVPVDGCLSIGSTNRSARLRDQPKHSKRNNLACDNGTAVVLYELAGESGGSMQSSATRFWHLKHLVQDYPGNCAHEEQFGTNLLR